ncbi:MAG TPA: AMP-binding protein [Bradyrhizobium sp.]|nr:AMP-binding protein [Bradyrhizobium sp.]
MSAILDAVAGHARKRPNAVALTDGSVSLTYNQLWHDVETLAGDLSDIRGAQTGVALCLDNSPSWVLLDLALLRLGYPVAPLPLFFTEDQRRHAIAQTGARILITDRALAGRDGPGSLTILGRNLSLHNQDPTPVELPRDTAKITYTSGTTGQPKGVCLSQIGLEQVAVALVDVIGDDYAGIHCAVLPLAILLENIAGLYPTLLTGGRYHVPPQASLGFARPFQPDFQMLAHAIEACAATSAIMVPEILAGLMGVIETGEISLPAMKLLAVGGAKVSRGLLERAEALQLPVFQGYGLSEAGSVVSLNTPRDNRLGSVGRPLPHIALRFAANGEILMTPAAFLGYVGEDRASALTAMGDLGHLDHGGHLHIDGRKSNLLITAFGRNVAPEWVESELLSQPEIGQAMVFGDGMPALGALIVPSSEKVRDTEIAGVVDRANEGLPEYAQIRHWSKVAPFTMLNHQLTGNGRLRRLAIHEEHQARIARCLEQPGQYVSFFEVLVAETATGRARLQDTPQIRDGLLGRISRQTYLHYLAEAYHHVKHTVGLMKRAKEHMPPEKIWMCKALDEYIADETGHEEWILDDIAAAGGDASAVRRGRPRLATEVMVAYAYDEVERMNPVGLFGMVFVLESTSMQLASRGAQALMRSLKLPETCFRYLLSHGALDIDHIRFFQNLMMRVEDPDDRAAIIDMAKAMFILYGDVFRSIPHTMDAAHVN